MSIKSNKVGGLIDSKQAAEDLEREADGNLDLVQRAVDNTEAKIAEVRPNLLGRGVYGRRKEVLPL